jgi:hypothetical protein
MPINGQGSRTFNFRNPSIAAYSYRFPTGVTTPQQTNNYHYAAFAAGNLTASRTIRGLGNGPNGSNTFLMNLYRGR